MEKTITIPLAEYLHLVEFKKNIKEGKCVRVVDGYFINICFYNPNEAVEEIADENKCFVNELEEINSKLKESELKSKQFERENKLLKDLLQRKKNNTNNS